jgi:heme A synthase
MAWRRDARLRRKFALATWVMAGLFALKLAVQLPLYYAHQVAALGIAKLAMGIPLFVLVAWAIWLMVRNEELPRESEDQPQQTR